VIRENLIDIYFSTAAEPLTKLFFFFLGPLIKTKAKRDDWFGKYLPSFLRRCVDFLGNHSFIAGETVQLLERRSHFNHLRR
jgi:hypothetical protein